MISSLYYKHIKHIQHYNNLLHKYIKALQNVIFEILYPVKVHFYTKSSVKLNLLLLNQQMAAKTEGVSL